MDRKRCSIRGSSGLEALLERIDDTTAGAHLLDHDVGMVMHGALDRIDLQDHRRAAMPQELEEPPSVSGTQVRLLHPAHQSDEDADRFERPRRVESEQPQWMTTQMT